MKCLNLMFLLSFYALPLAAQTTTEYKQVFTYVERMPQSHVDVDTFLKNNLIYPADAIKAHKEGRVIVTFVINTQGNVDSVIVIKPLYPSLDAEAIHVIKSMPPWIPGRQNGHLADVYMNITHHV